MSRRNRSQAERKHSWDQVTARYLTLYNGTQRHAPVRRTVAELPSGSW